MARHYPCLLCGQPLRLQTCLAEIRPCSNVFWGAAEFPSGPAPGVYCFIFQQPFYQPGVGSPTRWPPVIHLLPINGSWTRATTRLSWGCGFSFLAGAPENPGASFPAHKSHSCGSVLCPTRREEKGEGDSRLAASGRRDGRLPGLLSSSQLLTQAKLGIKGKIALKCK